MARPTRVLSTTGAAKANELAKARHEKKEVFMFGEILILVVRGSVGNKVDVRIYG